MWTDGGATDVVVQNNHMAGQPVSASGRNQQPRDGGFEHHTQSQQQSILGDRVTNVTVTHNTLTDNFGGIIVGGVGTVEQDGNPPRQRARLRELGRSIRVRRACIRLPRRHVDQPSIDDHFVGGHLQWDGHGSPSGPLQSLGQERHGTWSK